MPDDVHKITIQLRAPRGNNPGKVAIGYYVVADSHVVLTDEIGKPIGNEKYYIEPGTDARLIACRMLRKRQGGSRPGGFGGSIAYPKVRY
jgi:hypothetical protein